MIVEDSCQLVQSVYHKRTRQGRLVRITHERYPRRDCNAGYLHGRAIDPQALLTIMEEASLKEIVVVDTNIVIHHIDALESAHMNRTMIIFCQTVLSETRKLNSSIFKRATSLLADANKHFLFYPNELSAMTLQTRYLAVMRTRS